MDKKSSSSNGRSRGGKVARKVATSFIRHWPKTLALPTCLDKCLFTRLGQVWIVAALAKATDEFADERSLYLFFVIVSVVLNIPPSASTEYAPA